MRNCDTAAAADWTWHLELHVPVHVHHADNVASWHHSCRTAHNTEARPMRTTVLVLQQGCLPPSVTMHGTDASIPMFLGLPASPDEWLSLIAVKYMSQGHAALKFRMHS